MPPLTWKSHAVLSAATLTAIFSAACTDATGPSNGKPVGPTSETNAPRPSGGPSRGTDSTRKAVDQKPSAIAPKPSWLVQTNSVTGPQTAPGSYWFSPPSVVVSATSTARIITVGGIRAYEVPNDYNLWATAARADVYLWRWNGSSYGTTPYMTASSFTGRIAPNKFVDLSSVAFYPPTGGHYTVTVRITWTNVDMTGVNRFLASRDFWFNSASDYLAVGRATAYAGCVVLQ